LPVNLVDELKRLAGRAQDLADLEKLEAGNAE